jgi:hypothetical protein
MEGFIPSTARKKKRVEVGRSRVSRVQCQPELHSEFQVSLYYIVRPCLKNPPKKKKRKKKGQARCGDTSV